MEKNSELKYNQLYLKLDGIIEKTFNLLNEYGNTETITTLKSKLDVNSARTELKVAFVGQYNSGKSTIISALTSNKDIIIGSNVATNVSFDYSWNNIKITDTPGILAGKIEQHDISTKETLSKSDLIVYVLTSQLFDDVLFENFIELAYTQKLKDKILITINKMSMERGDFNSLKDNYTLSLKNDFNLRGYDFDFEIIFIDAFDYIEGINEKEEELIQLSNFKNFIEALNLFIEKKGLIQKAFDTPIRIIRDELIQIALNETDPSFNLILNKYENRLLKHKKELINEVGFALNDLKDKILTEGYSISSIIDGITQEEFDVKQSKFNTLLETEPSKTMVEIENIINEKNSKLSEEFEDIANDSDVIIYSENLTSQCQKKKLEKNFNTSSLNSKINLLNSLKSQGEKLSKFTGASKSAGLFAKSGEISGSSGHKLVKDIGGFLGTKFKPWQAVKITKNVGNIAKIAGPVLAVFSVGFEIYGAVKEEKELKSIVNSKIKMNEDFSEIAKEIISGIKKNFDDYLINNVDSKIKEYQTKKIDIIKINDTNSKFQTAINKLDSDFIEFIEVVNS